MSSSGKRHSQLTSLLQSNARLQEIAAALDLVGDSSDVRTEVIRLAGDPEFIGVLNLGLPLDCAFRIEAAWQQWCQLPVRPRVRMKLLRSIVRHARQIEDGLIGLETFCDDLPEDEA